MFPSNYTEVLKLDAIPPPEVPRLSTSTERNRSSSYEPPQPIAVSLLPPDNRQRSISSGMQVPKSAPVSLGASKSCSQCNVFVLLFNVSK